MSEISKQRAFPNPNTGTHGLTKLEYFAGLAMQGLLSADTEYSRNASYISREAIAQAKSILELLEQKP